MGALVLAGLGIVAAYYGYRGAAPIRAPAEGTGPKGGLEWLTPIVVVDLIFAVFVVVQVNVLFGGHEYVLGAGRPDYADYARAASANSAWSP